MSSIEIYWMPGCSGCLRMKEFVERTGLPFEDINVDAVPERAGKLAEHGVRVPATCVGDRCVNGIDLAAVAELIGVAYEPPAMLAPVALAAKYDVVMAALRRYVAQLPEESYGHLLPGRNRDVLTTAAHAATVTRYFVRVYDDESDTPSFDSLMTPVRTASAVDASADETLRMFHDWWERDGFDDPHDRVLPVYWGHRTLHEALEREVWHTAQHTRQVMYVLELLGIEPAGPLTADDLAGLPLPERVHD